MEALEPVARGHDAAMGLAGLPVLRATGRTAGWRLIVPLDGRRLPVLKSFYRADRE